MSLVAEVIEAHGGMERWRRAEAISLALSSGGLAFAAKGQRTALHAVQATVSTTGQSVDLRGAGWRHRFDDGFPAPHGVRWQTADIAAFAACALWTYVSLPFVLPDLDTEEQGRRITVRFPRHLRTHCPTQVLHIGDDGLIRHHDYTALDFGRWARARQDVGGYRSFDGLMIATRRRVRPRLWPHRPLLVWIDVSTAQALPAAG